MVSASKLIWSALRSLRSLKSLITGLSAVTTLLVALWPRQSASNAPSAPPDLRQLADALSRDLLEVARKCATTRTQLNRGRSPWRTPETLELSMAWYQLVQVAEFVAGRDAQYGQDLQSTDPNMRVIAAVSPSSPKKRGARNSAGAGQASGFGQPATGTVPALTGKLARQLDRDLNEVFRKTARAAQDCSRQLPANQPVTAFGVAGAIASIHALNEWLTEQVQRIQRQYRIGMRGQPPVA